VIEKNGPAACDDRALKANSKDLCAEHTAPALKSQASPAPLGTAVPSLRDYQQDAVTRVRAAYSAGARSVLLVMPTGAGKTVTFAYIITNAVRGGRRILIIAHRVELLDQIAGALDLAGVAYGVMAPGCPDSDAHVQIASVATLARRLPRWRDRFDFVVADEGHHAVSATWASILASQPSAHVLGVTATPERLDGRGLKEIFDALIEGPSTGELIEQKWLSPFVCYEPIVGPNLSGARLRAGDYAIEDIREAMGGVVIGSAVDEYHKRLLDRPTVAFCVDVEHSMAVAERFRAAGVKAAHVDGETSARERRAAIAALGDGSLQVLCNCGLISEGVDVPAIVGAILLRPTASLALYLQQVGRALRPAPGKNCAVILDFAGNVARHGLPDAPRAWSLDAQARRARKKTEGAPRPRRCECGALNQPRARICAECGADIRTAKERAEVEIALCEAQRTEQEKTIARMFPRDRWTWAGSNVERLRLVARVSGYKPGWVYMRLQSLTREGARS
jgi:DNA repair protein RadD